jgi:uncharacterized membrane protein
MPADSVRAGSVDGRGARTVRLTPSYGALVWALLGLAASAYLTVEHYTASTLLACPENATINCAKVTSSKWSHVLGVPVAVLGLGYFVLLVALCLPAAWRVAALERWRIAAVAIGAISVVYLVYIELFKVDAICLWCTAVHVCTIAVLATVLWRSVVADA